MVQQLQFPGDLSWWKGSGAPSEGKQFEESEGQLPAWVSGWPTYSASCPGEVIKWCLGMKVGWIYAPLLHLRVSSVSWGGK